MQQDTFSTDDTEPPGTGVNVKGIEKTANLIPIRTAARPSIFPCNPRASAFREKFFPDSTLEEWGDWHWQLKNRITDAAGLNRMLVLGKSEQEAIGGSSKQLPLAITPYYASLLEYADPAQPLRRTVIPTMMEFFSSAGESTDPLGEEHDSPTPGLIHRYPDRVLFLATAYCSTYCRYCTRSRLVGDRQHAHVAKKHWERAIDYIENTPQVRDVLISGGDPLTMSNEKLEWLLKRLRRISHVEIIRIGTKAPAVLPHRITPVLVRMLKKYHPLWLSIHFTHPDELTLETTRACEMLADVGIPLGSQTVLLGGINDDVDTMKKLFQGLLKMRVRPYYLYQCDPISGSGHFRTPIQRGLDIILGLRGHTTGYALPNYVIDAPGGGGKIPLLPEYVVGREGGDLLIKNYEGKVYRYPEVKTPNPEPWALNR